MPALSGTVKDSSGAFVSRLVRAYRRDTGVLVGAVISDPTTGAWSVATADTGEHFAVVHDAVGNPLWSSVILAMHFDGADNSTTFADLRGHTVTPSGTAKISTAQYKFGGSSVLFASGDHLSIAHAADLDVGSSNLTMSFWVRTTAGGTIVSKRVDSGSEYRWMVVSIDATGKVTVQVSTTGASWALTLTTTNAITPGTWGHVALVRNGNTFTIYVNGVAGASGALTGSIFTGTYPILIGKGGTTGAYTSPFVGNLDDFFFGNTALYTANFTPTTSAFLDGLSGGTENALILDRLVPV